ncbi:hypothetical protein DSECCO2_488470 [anaerobic digester metagenome]
MDRSEVYPLVYIGLFLIFYSLLASSALSAVSSSLSLEQPVIPNYIPNSENIAYEVYDGTNSSCDGLQYYNVTMDGTTVETWMIAVTGYNDVQVIVNSNVDRIQFSKTDEGAWFDFSWDITQVLFDKAELLTQINDIDTDTQLNIKIRLEKVFEVNFVSNVGESIYNGILNDRYTLIFGENKANASEEEGGALDSFIKLVTFDIPNMPSELEFLIAMPIYLLGSYLAIRVILMFLPFVSGGA